MTYFNGKAWPNRAGEIARVVERFFFLFSGYAILHPPMAVEKLGVRQNQRPENGPRPGHHLRSGEATEEKATVRLSLLKPEEPQLLGIPILLL